MNIIKFVSVALWSMCMLFLSCKKENPSLNETPATVEIFVCNSKGEPLENSTVETITFEGEEAPELTGNPFPFKENILKIVVPSGKSEAYKAKWGSYEGYHSKIEEKS